ncbi:MAG TPA: response regulator [bacterium]
MKKRILFVDDEPQVLQGLQRMLHSMRNDWSMEFASSAFEGLRKLENGDFHVVVSDMRMPRMDGAEFLALVMKKYPKIIRFILSGHSDKELIMKSIGSTHQYLTKPCDAETLKRTVARALALRNLLMDDSLKELVSHMKTLPSLPTLYLQLIKELQAPDTTMSHVGEIISQDVGMTAKVLQLVNSSFFGLSRHVSTPEHAAKLLGAEIIKAVVLSVQIFAKFENSLQSGLSLENLINHSMAVGALAQKISLSVRLNSKISDNAFIAGMLHDAGKLILAENLPEKYSKAVSLARLKKMTIGDAERDIFGATHAEVGAYLIGLWGLPDNIVEALAFHHRPGECLDNTFSPLTAVHAANCLYYELNPGPDDLKVNTLDAEYLKAVGYQDRLGVWRELCATVKRS